MTADTTDTAGAAFACHEGGLDRRWGGPLMSLELTELGPLNECLPLICREQQRGAVRILGVPDCHAAIGQAGALRALAIGSAA